MGSANEADALGKPLPPLPGQSSMLDVGESSRDAPSQPPQYEEVSSPASRAAAAAFTSQEPLPPALPPPATNVSSMMDPPPYAEDAELVQDILIPAGTLRLADRSIFAAEAAPDAAPLYELDQTIGYSRTAFGTITLSRLEHRIKRGSEVATRVRGISELVQTPPVTGPTFPFHARATIAKAHTLGSLGLVPCVGGYRVHRAEGKSMAQREQLFRATRATKKHGETIGSYDWFAVGDMAGTIVVPADGGQGPSSSRPGHRRSFSKSFDGGMLIAKENTEHAAGTHTLEVIVSLDQRTRDALVASWCLRLWEDIAARNKPYYDAKSKTTSTLKTLARNFHF
ncbi:hypothetical protein M0657_006164 [Pyricularia oryzae]|uniref:Uncharacterized protein n=2 Tax=Pyricularia oryzae TaxID=318829 RepID=A0AA97P412_PYRO3|nr:hypothetical protein OOU_Y34scaffold00262g27 [Pyricularia oryzae Y34]KAI7921185.1 hypothetical protein M0657_006164 [Pyricularia oryzae]KAI7931459.1 hypothetical protein M9X92_000290 [Pyricularia oryzae]